MQADYMWMHHGYRSQLSLDKLNINPQALAASMTPQNVNLWVSAGAFSSPYYRFYTDSSGSQEFTDTTLDIGKTYTFMRLGEATTHPFYISYNRLKAISSDALVIEGQGSPSLGISGDQSFRLEFTESASAADQLKYYCSAHSSMQGAFRLVGEYNYPPTHFTLSNLYIDENTPVGSQVGTLNSVDLNFDDAFTYSLVSGAGDIDNYLFAIDANRLIILESPNFENKSSYSIRLRTSDSSDLSLEKSFTLSVNDLNDTTIPKPTPAPAPASTLEPETEPTPKPKPETYDGIIQSVPGKGKLKGTNVGDAFTFSIFELFTKKDADKIIGFDTFQGDTIVVNPNAFPALQGVSEISFVSTRSKKEFKLLSKEDYDFVYFEKKGRLYFNGNGAEKNWGNTSEGGLVAILKGNPKLTAEDIILLA